jgi:hypothetical protein
MGEQEIGEKIAADQRAGLLPELAEEKMRHDLGMGIIGTPEFTKPTLTIME